MQPSIYQNSSLITVTESAINKIKSSTECSKNKIFRISIVSGGCSGFSTEFKIEDTTNYNEDDDFMLEISNIKIAFNKNGLPSLKKILISCVIIFLFSHTKYIPSILSDLKIIFSNIVGFKKIKVAVPVFPFLDFVNFIIGKVVSLRPSIN